MVWHSWDHGLVNERDTVPCNAIPPSEKYEVIPKDDLI